MRSIFQFHTSMRLGALACLALASALAQPAQAQILTIDDANNNLGTLNISTGAVAIIGNMGGDTMTDIAYSPTGTLYGTSFTRLYQINNTTGQATRIGNTGVSGSNALVFGSDGTLYLASATDTRLFTVNTSTGAATAIGNTGFDSAGDLAFNGGSLYMSSSTNQLIRINLAGGVSGTAIGSFGFANVTGIASAGNGVLYGVAGTQIFSVNTTTGQGTLVRNFGGQGLSNAFGESFISEALPVPEPGSVALVLSLTVMGAGFLAFRKYARKAA